MITMGIILKTVEVCIGVVVFAIGLGVAYWIIYLILGLIWTAIDSLRRKFNKDKL